MNSADPCLATSELLGLAHPQHVSATKSEGHEEMESPTPDAPYSQDMHELWVLTLDHLGQRSIGKI